MSDYLLNVTVKWRIGEEWGEYENKKEDAYEESLFDSNRYYSLHMECEICGKKVYAKGIKTHQRDSHKCNDIAGKTLGELED